MPKTKLKVKPEQMPALELSAEFNDVKLGESQQIGDRTVVEVSFKAPQNLFDLGAMLDLVSIPEPSKTSKTKKEEEKNA